MDDLSGLDWSSSSANKTSKPPGAAATTPFAYPSLRPTPSPLGSGRNTPLSAQGSGFPSGLGTGNKPAPPPPAKPAQDSFSGLISFGSGAKNPAHLSLRERQELLNAEKRKKEAAQQAAFGSGLELLGSGGGSALASRTASPAIPGPPAAAPRPDDGDDALFAAFKADTKVDQASYYPPAAADSGRSSRQPTPANAPAAAAAAAAPLDLSSPDAWGTKPTQTTTTTTSNNDDDDDPFGLSQFQAKAAAAAPPAGAPTAADDDDFLGDLGRPVEEVRREAEEKQRRERERLQQQLRERERQRPRPSRQPAPGQPIEDSSDSESSGPDPAAAAPTGNAAFDKAVAQLVDYGFSAQDAQRGLAASGRGTDVQAAVNWLLDDAHRQAKEKARAKQGGGGAGLPDDSRPAHRSRFDEGHPPARTDSRSPAAAAAAVLGDGDFAKTAAVVGSQFLKTANSLWKTGQKRVQKAVQDFQQDAAADPSQPRWMRDAALEQDHAAAAAASAAASAAAATDEAMMLESGRRPERRPAPASSHTTSRAPSSQATPSRNNSPVPRWQQQQQPPVQQQQQQRSGADPRLRLTKQALKEESAQAYVSPARRRRTPAPSAAASTPPPAAAPAQEGPEVDLLNSTALPQRPAAQRPAAASRGGGGSRPAQARPAPPAPKAAAAPRRVPPVAAGVLAASAQQRAAGAAHFRRGDYAAAHAAYAAALAGLPDAHPLRAVLLCNRALTALKTGEPRQAVADADAALAVIGPGRGAGEAVALEDGTAATRDLGELYGKALTRKAEALEQMEKWAEAGGVWQQCAEAGVGGATALAGRQRCQKALAPKAPPAAKPAVRPAAKRAPSAKPASSLLASSSSSSAPTSSSGQDFAAVSRLRAANAAAEREDAEKLALADKVDARIAAWRDGKKDNLRALLGSMDAVLWEGSGWKKVGLHELVMPNKVKVAYMRAIAKTHPDKLPPDASTEVRMVAGTVFATLNESWDKFKADNKL